MKKISTLLIGALAFGFSATAQDLVPEELTSLLNNPDFEIFAEGVEPLKGNDNTPGWDKVGDFSACSEKSFTGDDKVDPPTPRAPFTSGTWYSRIMIGSGALDAGTVIKQYITPDKPIGTFVLTCAARVSRNGMNGNIDALENMFGGAYIAEDADEAPFSTASRGFHKFTETGWDWHQAVIVYTTTEDECGIEVGFGIPEECNGIPKGCINIDNFQLYYFPTTDTEAVRDYVVKNIASVEDITVAPATKGDNKYYNLQGIEIAKPNKAGIYIHNGKKYIVR